LSSRLHRFGHHFLAGGDFTLADGGTALSAEIIEDFLFGQD
jgi:hypothetical protein